VPPVKPDCKFCAIARGEGDARIVLDDGDVLAFLDHRPLFPGHCLVIPREHHETLSDLPLPMLEPLFGTARVLSGAVQEALGADGSFVAVNNVVSQSVPHLHVHVVPRRRKDGLRGFFWPRSPYRDDAHAEEVAEALRRAVARRSQHFAEGHSAATAKQTAGTTTETEDHGGRAGTSGVQGDRER
jgi:histidine triad (HIT) family protein